MKKWAIDDVATLGVRTAASLSSFLITPLTASRPALTGSAPNLGNGNTLTGQATVTRSNGTTTQIDSVAVTASGSEGASNLERASNPFYREFTTPVAVSATARGLPEMGGSGVVRDLREAMSLGTAQSSALVSAVQAFANGTTRSAQQASLDELLRTWAATEQVADRFAIRTVGQETRRFTVNGSTDAALQAQLNRMIPVLEV